MYKSKLQELCQLRAWDLPDYVTTKEGPDHNPCFQATVTVNGLSFHSQSPTKSSKRAQNDVAKLAFDHFWLAHASPPPPPPSPPPTPPPSPPPTPAPPVSLSTGAGFSSNISSGETLQFKVEETNQTPEVNGPPAIAKDDGIFTDMQHLYKNQLQSYAQKRNLTLPVYSCERVGPPHNSRFKCKVTIDGQTYESQEFFPTLSKAEHAAAKAALMSLAPNGVEEDESAYKNLLQELAQKESYGLPTYSTVISGEGHRPTFVSTVNIGGELFTGQEVRTKKQAELSAAKVAYIALKQRNSKQGSMVSSSCNSSLGPVASCSGNSSQSSMPSCSGNSRQSPVASCSANLSQSAPCPTPPQQGQKVNQFTTYSSRLDLAAFLQQNVQPRMPGHDDQAEEDEAAADVVSRDPPIASPGPESSSVVNRIPSISSLPESGMSSSSSLSDSSTYSAVSIEHPVGTNISCHTKVIVHPRGTNMTYPPGSIVLSMSDVNWVAVRTPESS
ncbi:hypothetical protein GH714_004759 [Hevea brasiliensis]|uniref:DRBM domain-containing protein n=1 Tax=Hevea brasiliensis TaxID=3981 RepID=A0A6A6KIA8_HEVBR|nr:hypothetical protein GH714_004759 [Hevea brasiliensis]